MTTTKKHLKSENIQFGMTQKMRLKVNLQLAEEGGYIISCPRLPGCTTQGETKEEALANIKEAISLYLEDLKEEEMSIPPSFEQEVVEVHV
tara:strand:+ start:58 stop:330 length:273 start_codon:yes stop_codon:yes gene_type:complete